VSDGPGAERRLSLEGSWIVESLAVGGELVPPLEGGEPLTLVVSDEKVSGTSGVNRFTGRLGDGNSFSSFAMTRMAGPEELMAQEAILQAHFESVDSIESSDSETLLLAGGQVVVTLAPMGTDQVPTAS